LNVFKKGGEEGEAMKCQCPKCKAEEGEQLGVIRDCVNVQEAKYLIYRCVKCGHVWSTGGDGSTTERPDAEDWSEEMEHDD
jgi:uncharacterized Zn finger protein